MKSHFVYFSNDLINCSFFDLSHFFSLPIRFSLLPRSPWFLFSLSASPLSSISEEIFRVIYGRALPFPCSCFCNQLSGKTDQTIAHQRIRMWQLLQCIFINEMNALASSTCSTISHTEEWKKERDRKGKIRDIFKNALPTIKLKRPIMQSNEFAAECRRLKSI